MSRPDNATPNTEVPRFVRSRGLGRPLGSLKPGRAIVPLPRARPHLSKTDCFFLVRPSPRGLYWIYPRRRLAPMLRKPTCMPRSKYTSRQAGRPPTGPVPPPRLSSTGSTPDLPFATKGRRTEYISAARCTWHDLGVYPGDPVIGSWTERYMAKLDYRIAVEKPDLQYIFLALLLQGV